MVKFEPATGEGARPGIQCDCAEIQHVTVGSCEESVQQSSKQPLFPIDPAGEHAPERKVAGPQHDDDMEDARREDDPGTRGVRADGRVRVRANARERQERHHRGEHEDGVRAEGQERVHASGQERKERHDRGEYEDGVRADGPERHGRGEHEYGVRADGQERHDREGHEVGV